jgi:RHS repeat-associated protein
VNGSGTVLDQLAYASYGSILSESNAANGDRFKFACGEYDPILGTYRFNARYYGPGDGRFISQDPKGFQAGDSNLYRYTKNGPVNTTDPSGLFSWYGAGNDLDNWLDANLWNPIGGWWNNNSGAVGGGVTGTGIGALSGGAGAAVGVFIIGFITVTPFGGAAVMVIEIGVLVGAASGALNGAIAGSGQNGFVDGAKAAATDWKTYGIPFSNGLLIGLYCYKGHGHLEGGHVDLPWGGW